MARSGIRAFAGGFAGAGMLRGSLNPTVLGAALMQGWDELSVLYWSAHEDEQAGLDRLDRLDGLDQR